MISNGRDAQTSKARSRVKYALLREVEVAGGELAFDLLSRNHREMQALRELASELKLELVSQSDNLATYRMVPQNS
ncbi:MAG: hypothetical protein QOH96_1982 [Blastocatellia bacterium]|jgi:hypothetical protein|nr:hypothetical protein [Blastocatellia bacterium]